VRALAISDMHFGAWTGEPLLRHQFALDALEPHFEEIDELILLGDVFDFLFSPVEQAFAQADSFFALIQRKLEGKRVVFLAGNHDHHIVVRFLRAAVELKIATGATAEMLSELYCTQHRSFFQRFLDRRLHGIESEIVYPTYRVGDVLLSHGHYLDAHLHNSIGNRLLVRSVRRIAGGSPEAQLTVEDYEALVVPLTELLFTVAQMPRGTAAQQAFYEQFQRLGRLMQVPSVASRDIAGVGSRLASNLSAFANSIRLDLAHRRRTGRRAAMTARDHDRELDDHAIRSACATPTQDGALSPRPTAPAGIRACDPTAPTAVGVEAYANVIQNLHWGRGIEQVVFAHTHQPLDGVCDASETIRFWNTGSWIYEPPRRETHAYRAYLERAWPGTGVLIDTQSEAPVLIEMLSNYHPIGVEDP
jgi:UDP-2,3-diacylglucosamine pyrophosphatase LpxH